MSDVNANINISIDSSQALAQLRSLQNQITAFNKSVVAGNSAAMNAQRELNRSLATQINATKQFSTSMVNVESSVSRLGTSIDKGRLSLGQYFRYGTAASGVFGKAMKENVEIMALAESRVKRLQTQYVALGAAQNGYTKAMAIRPNNLFNADAAISIQRQQIFNKLLNDGSTSLINWGKNTQWAGRQLMVGFTVPLTIFGGVAAQTFMDLEKQIVQFRRVYGDLGTMKSETDEMIREVQRLGSEFTKYGISVSDTIALAADAAAAGYEGADLIAQTTEATRLATLGQISYQQALDATISLQTAFGTSSEELAESTDFLNAVENQTVLSLDDITQSIPIVATVIKGLGGDVKDLAALLTAMREGGVNANEGANALKTSLARLIAPTKAASERAKEFNINLKGIVESNEGDLMGMIMSLENAMRGLSSLDRQKFLSDLFGKRQFARMGALFSNIAKEGSQASRVIDLTAMSTEELGQIAERELGNLEQAVGVKFTSAVEKLKLAIAPVGEAFLKIATPIIEFATKVADKFNSLPDAAKTFITWAAAIGGVLVPTVVMLVGLIGNFAGQIIKLGLSFGRIIGKTQGAGHSLDYLTEAELDAMAASASLEGQTNGLTSALNMQRGAVVGLARSYGRYVSAAQAAASNLPQGFRNPTRRGFASGGINIVPGKGDGDTIPAMLTPGESVITKEATEKYGPILAAMNEGTLPGFARGDVQVSIPGSWEASHFGGQGSMTGQELIDWSSGKSQAIQDKILSMVNSVENGLERVFTTLDNRVTALSREVNQGVGKTGSGKTVDTSLVRRDLMDRGDIAHPELVRQLKAAGVSTEDIKGIVSNLTSEIQVGFDQLGDVATMTAEDIDNLTDAAYRRLAEIDERVDVAYQKMLEPTTLIDPNARGGKQERIAIGPSYKGARGTYTSQMDDVATAPIPYTKKAAIKINEDVAGRLGASRREVAAAFSTLEDSVKVRLSGLVDDADVFAREMSSELRNAGMTLAEAALEGERRGFRTSSPSREAADIGDSVPEGTAEGIRRSTGLAVDAAHDMTNQVKGQMAMDFDDDGLFPADPYRDPRGPQYSPIPTPAARPVPSNVVTNMSMLDEAYGMNAAFNAQKKAIDGLTNETKKTKGLMSKMGGALKGGSMKLTSAMFALDGVVFGLSMLDNSIGEMAQKIMPAVFGLQGLQMIAPMLMNPVGLAVAAIAATAAGLWYLNKLTNDAAEASREYARAMLGSANDAKEYSKALGTVSNIEKEKARQLKSKTGEEVSDETVTEARAFLEQEVGQTLLERIKNVRDVGGADSAAKALVQNLSRQIAAGTLSSDMAKAIANEVGAELGSTDVSIDAVMGINSILGPNGEDYLVDPLRITTELVTSGLGLQEAMANAGAMQDQLGVMSQLAMLGKGEGTVDLFAEQASALTAEKLNIIAEGEAALNEAIASGKIQGDEAIAQLEKLSELRSQVSVSENLAQAKEISDVMFGEGQFDGTQADKYLQGIINSFMTSDAFINLGADGARKFREGLEGGLESEMQVLKKGSSIGQITNWFNPNELRTGMDALQRNLLALRETRNASEVGTRDFTMASQEISRTLQDIEKLGSWIEDMPSAIAAVQAGAIELTEDMSPEDLIDKWNDFKEAIPTAQWLQDQLPEEGMLYKRLFGQGAGDLPEETMTKLTKAAISAKAYGVELETVFSMAKRDIPTTISMMEDFDNVFGESFDKLTKAQKKKITLDFVTNTLNWNDQTVNWFENLPVSKQKEFILYVTTKYNELGSPSDILARTGGNVEAARWYGGGSTGQGVSKEELARQDFEEDETEIPPLEEDEEKDKGGSGSKKETPIKDFIKKLVDNVRLYDNAKLTYNDLINSKKNLLKLFKINKGIDDELRSKYKDQNFVDAIVAMGPEVAKRFTEMSEKKGKRVARTFLFSQGSDARNELDKQLAQERNKEKGIDILKGAEVDQEIIDKFSGDSSIMAALSGYAALGKKGKKGLEDLISKLKELYKLQEKDPSRDILKEMQDGYSNIIKSLQDEIDLIEKKIEGYEDSVDALEELNDADKDRIEGLQRQKEIISRQIDAIERANELDERRVNNLQREDELRNRVSQALQRELELMSRAETDIRDTYQARIDALDKVAKLNDYILQSQRNQLNLSQALSQGDVYAAAQAASEMQRGQVDFAAQSAREALQQGMENQISGLTTAGGLTREQAEEQIQAIQDQSYQTQLQIRDIQDQIYIRNQEMIPLKDQQYNLDLQIRDIEDIIYNRNSEIKDIQEKQIQPLQDQIEKLNNKIEMENAAYDAAKANVEAIQAGTGATQEQEAAAVNLANQWLNVAQAIDKANKAYAKQSVDVSKKYSAGTITKTDYLAQLQAAEDARNESIKKAREMAGFAAGGIVGGMGGRDSVFAKLTPGEMVIRKPMVSKYGVSMLDKINQGSYPTYSMGGPKASVAGGGVASINAPVYNTYSVNVPVTQPNASADEIAHKVMTKIKNMDNASIRRVNGY